MSAGRGPAPVLRPWYESCGARKCSDVEKCRHESAEEKTKPKHEQRSEMEEDNSRKKKKKKKKTD
jgi:hypothetical protein